MKGFQLTNDLTWNYHYDSIGNLTRDLNEGIIAIYWTVTGKGREGFFEHRTRINERRFKKYLRMNELQSTQNGHPNGILHSSILNTSVFLVRCSLFGVQGGSSRLGMVTQPEALHESP